VVQRGEAMSILGASERSIPDETHVYRVQARLAKWKHESDGDYHLVLTDDTLSYGDEGANPPVPPTGHSFIGEMPDPNCLSGSDGSFGSQTPFADGMISARQAMEQRFPNPDQSGAWNDGAGAPVEITGIGFFDRPTSRRDGLRITLKFTRSFQSGFWITRLPVRAQPQLQDLNLHRRAINGNTR
jgi:hypothetical protein